MARSFRTLLVVLVMTGVVVGLCGCGGDGNEVTSVDTAKKPVKPPRQEEGFEPAIACQIQAKGLAVLSADGTQHEVIHSLKAGWQGYYVRPTWKPDGTRIAYITHDALSSDPWTLHFIDPDGSGRVDVGEPVPPTHTNEPDWCPGSERLMYNTAQSIAPNDFVVYDVPTGPYELLGLTQYFEPPEYEYRYPSEGRLSPDMGDEGGYQGLMAFISTSPYGPDGPNELWVVKVDDSTGTVKVADGASPVRVPGADGALAGQLGELAFAPNGGAIAYMYREWGGTISRSVRTVDVINYETLEFGNYRTLYEDGGQYVGGVRGSLTWSSHPDPGDQMIVFTACSGEMPGGASANDLYWVPVSGTGGGWLTQPGDKISVSQPDWNRAWTPPPS